MVNKEEEHECLPGYRTKRCPECGGRVYDELETVSTEIRLVRGSPGQNDLWLEKCWRCGNTLGIRKTE